MKHILIAIGLLLSVGCSSTQVVSSWAKPNTQLRKYNRVVVVALTGEENRELRSQMESQLVQELNRNGFNAVSAYSEYGPQHFSRSDESAAMAALKKSNADAVMTIVLLDASQETYYVPGNVSYAPAGPYYNYFWGYYGTIYDRVYTPGYYRTSTRFFWESNLYDLNNNKELVYSIETEAFDPSSAHDLGEDNARKIVKDMIQKGVLLK